MPSTILSDNGVTSGTSGIKTTGSNDGTLALQTTTAGGAATTAVTIDTSQNVGIGGALLAGTPGGAAGKVLALAATQYPQSIMTATSATAGNKNIRFIYRDSGVFQLQTLDDTYGTEVTAYEVQRSTTGITYQAFYTGTAGSVAERMRIPSTGGIQSVNCISVGNATPSTSGAGVTFPATINASSNANTLDDYEEGTWTPVVTSQSGSITSYTSAGSYTKIGNIVTLYCNVQVTSIGTASGQMFINGAPFNTLLSGQYAGVTRETTATGYIYFPMIAGSQISIQNSTNGGVTWATNYRYQSTNVYETT